MQLAKKNKTILILFLFFLSRTLTAQEFPSFHYSINNGLPNNTIFSIYKDSRKILWVGTDNGVSAIKNGNIKNYNISNGLAHNSCWAIVEDSNKNLWFGSFGGGLSFYDGKKFSIINTKNGLIDDKIRTLFIFNKHLFVGTQLGFSVIDINSKKIVFNGKIRGKKGLFQVMDFFTKGEKVYFATFDDGVWTIDLKKKRFELDNHDIPSIFSVHQNNNEYYYSHISLDDKINNQLSIKDRNNKTIKKLTTRTIFWDYSIDKKGNLFGAGNGINFTNGGIYKILKKGLFKQNSSFSIPSYQVWSTFYDSELNLLFVGTIDQGLFIIELDSPISYYPSYLFNKKQLNIIEIDSFDTGELLILGRNELLLLKNNKILKEISKDDLFRFINNYPLNKYENWQANTFGSYKKIKPDEFQLKSFKVQSSQIWLSSNLGLFKITKDGKINTYHRTIVNQFSFLENNKLLFEEPYGFFWISSDLTKEKSFFKINDVRRNAVQIIELFNKKFILSKSLGLYSYQNGEFISYLDNKLWNEKELVCGTITNKNELVIATKSGDVFILDVSGKFKIKRKISSDQLLGNSISFVEYYKNSILVGNEKGIQIYKEGKIRTIDEEQGLKIKNINSSLITKNILYVGTNDGYYSIDLEKYFSKSFKDPKLTLSKIEVNFELFNKENIKWFSYNLKNLDLPHNKNIISLSFEPTNVVYPNKLLYRYNLKGIDNSQWSDWSNSKNINFNYLPPGDYSLLIEVKDLHFGKKTIIELLTIKISLPLWRKWWFILFVFIFISLIIFLVLKKRINSISKKQQEKYEIQQRLVETKMEALQSQMNPHFIFNAMNSIQYYILDNNIDKALVYLGEFSSLIRQTLYNSSKIRISLEDEITYLKHYINLENLRLNNTVAIKINIDDEIDLSMIKIPPMLIQPFVENIFLHAFNSESLKPSINISFKLEDECLICEIKDNGKGINSLKKNELYQSKGIKLVTERLSLLQGDVNFALDISSVPNKGTRVAVRIRIS